MLKFETAAAISEEVMREFFTRTDLINWPRGSLLSNYCRSEFGFDPASDRTSFQKKIAGFSKETLRDKFREYLRRNHRFVEAQY